MSLIKRISSIFTKDANSEIAHLTGAIDNQIEGVINQMSAMKVNTIISSSTGEWLDLWGDRFGITRLQGEADEPYRLRVMASVTNLKGTIPALIAAVKRALGDDTDVLVRETYNDLRIFNVSTFSGTGKFQDSDMVRLGVIILYINKYPNDELRREIWSTKALGVRVIIETRMESLDDSEMLDDGYVLHDSRIVIDDSLGISEFVDYLLDAEIYDTK